MGNTFKTIEDFSRAARTHRNYGELEQARDILFDGLRTYPESGNLMYSLGLTYREWNQPLNAYTCFKAAVELAPHVAPNHMSYARALMDMEDYDEAEKVYMRLLPKEEDRAKGKTFFALGKLYFETRRMDDAAVCFHYALERDKTDTAAMDYIQRANKAGGHFIRETEQAFLKRLAAILGVPEAAEKKAGHAPERPKPR